MSRKMEFQKLKNRLYDQPVTERLQLLAGRFDGKILFTTSFGMEDQVISHIIFTNDIPIEVATLDTGRLFPETYKVFYGTIEKYKKEINVFFPDPAPVEKMMTEKGPFSFYNSKEDRRECCRIRKVIPLNRALEGKECWVSGIRAAQSENRSQMDWFEYDEERKLYKFYPLFDWSLDEVTRYLSENNIPQNALHNKGFISIGCEPCTRAVTKGEDFRAGRWWWENDSTKECGVHIK